MSSLFLICLSIGIHNSARTGRDASGTPSDGAKPAGGSLAVAFGYSSKGGAVGGGCSGWG